jgi:hypothetical protein
MEQDCRDFKDRLIGLWRLRVATHPSWSEHCNAWHAERSRLLLWLGEEGLARMLGNARSSSLANAVLTTPQEAWAALLGCVAVVSSAQTWDWLGLGEQAQWAGWMGALCAGSLSARAALKRLTWPSVLSTHMGLVSAKPLWAQTLQDGYLMGYCADSGVPVRISNQSMMRHFLAAGMTGVGKTVSAVSLMMQQMSKGGGVLWIDGKLDPENMAMFFHMAKWLGRESDVRIINPADPALSNSYNFVLYGEPKEVASRILSTLPSTGLSAGSDYYKQAANQGLICILSALKALGLAYNCMDLAILLTHPQALRELDHRVNACSRFDDPRIASFKLFLETCKTPGARGAHAVLDAKKMRELFGGIAGRLFVYGSSHCGEVTRSYVPDIDLYDDLNEGRLIYCALPTMGQQISAQNFGKMVMGDLRTAIARLQSLPHSERREIPFLVWLDEVASYANAPTLATPFQQSRSAHLSLGVGFQEQSSIEELGPSFLGTLMGNTHNKLFFKPADRASAEAWSRTLGERLAWQSSLQEGMSEAFKFSFMGLFKGSRVQQTRSLQESVKEVREYRVSADRLAQLGLGQAIFLHASSEIFDLQIPKLEFSKDLRQALGGVCIQRPAIRARASLWREAWGTTQVPSAVPTRHPSDAMSTHVEGLYLYQRYREFLTELSSREETQAQLSRESSMNAKARFQSVGHSIPSAEKDA